MDNDTFSRGYDRYMARTFCTECGREVKMSDCQIRRVGPVKLTICQRCAERRGELFKKGDGDE